jgi:hypothetical protein
METYIEIRQNKWCGMFCGFLSTFFLLHVHTNLYQITLYTLSCLKIIYSSRKRKHQCIISTQTPYILRKVKI